MRAAFPLRIVRRISALFAFASAAALAGGTLFAAEQSRPLSAAKAKAAAESLLEEALACEIDGRGDRRDELLAKAEALAPEHPGIKWQRGMIFVDGKWTPAEEVTADSAKRVVVGEYVAKREASNDTLEGNLALAQWCQERKLFEQERAHLVRVLKYDPDHERARARLGFVRIDGEWISREEIARAIAEEARAQASIKKNGAGLKSVVDDLTSEYPALRERAAAKIRAIRDPETIPALERLVAGVSEEASFAVVEALAATPEKGATLSLARFAVLSSSYRVRNEALSALKDRAFDQFIPEMIATMRGRVQSAGYTLERRMDARLVYRQTFYREAKQSIDVILQDVVYANSQPSLYVSRFGRSGNPVVNASLYLDRQITDSAEFDSTIRSTLADAAIAIENGNARSVNIALNDALSDVTGEELGPDPHAWWTWWDEYNGLYQSGPKQVAVQYSQSWQSVGHEGQPDRARISDIRQPQIFMSCFAAGTPVLTNRGDVAIEQVRVGDLVLAQDVDSGEIAFKPVLETTVRPPADLLRVEHEQGSFRCTGGHPFWVSGEGWVHAKRLTSGMELHSLDGSVRVSDVVADGSEATYNLIVADFADYFVGEARILSHDNSSRQPTDAVVPGLVQK